MKRAGSATNGETSQSACSRGLARRGRSLNEPRRCVRWRKSVCEVRGGLTESIGLEVVARSTSHVIACARAAAAGAPVGVTSWKGKAASKGCTPRAPLGLLLPQGSVLAEICLPVGNAAGTRARGATRWRREKRAAKGSRKCAARLRSLLHLVQRCRRGSSGSRPARK